MLRTKAAVRRDLALGSMELILSAMLWVRYAETMSGVTDALLLLSTIVFPLLACALICFCNLLVAILFSIASRRLTSLRLAFAAAGLGRKLSDFLVRAISQKWSQHRFYCRLSRSICLKLVRAVNGGGGRNTYVLYVYYMWYVILIFVQ